MSVRLSLSVAVISVAFLAAGCQQAATSAGGTPPSDPVARGAYLALVGGCGDCHTPLKDSPQGPAPDASMLLAGHPATLIMPEAPPASGSPWAWYGAITSTAFAGPWGVSFAINLTPDPETGLGKWSEAQFVQALRTGRHLGTGRPILPPMPWPNLARMTDEDLSALFVYLRSIPAISNKVPEAIVAAPPAH